MAGRENTWARSCLRRQDIFDKEVRRKALAFAADAVSNVLIGYSMPFRYFRTAGQPNIRPILALPSMSTDMIVHLKSSPKQLRYGNDASRPTRHAQRPPRQRLRCVLGMLSSLEVKVLCPT